MPSHPDRVRRNYGDVPRYLAPTHQHVYVYFDAVRQHYLCGCGHYLTRVSIDCRCPGPSHSAKFAEA